MYLHGLVLIICSIVGFTGHYLQFGVLRITPWIPASVGLFTMLMHYLLGDKPGFRKYLPLIPVIVFGVTTTIMCLRFLPQDIQPVRKKIVFSVMSISAGLTVIRQLRNTFQFK